MGRIHVLAAVAVLASCAQRIDGVSEEGEPDAGTGGNRTGGPDGGRACTDACTAGAPACLDGIHDACVPGAGGCTELSKEACPAGLLDWVTVQGGAFQMGSATGGNDEQPIHQVTVGSLQVTRTEITAVQFAACVDAGACEVPAAGPNANWGADFRLYPVNYVRWEQANAFCAFAGGRLPSESEWESLAGGHRGYRYPWGTTAPSCDLANYDDGTDGCGTKRSAPTCSRPPGNSPEGLCDLGGNLWEWTLDWYHPSYTGAPADGSAWVSPAGSNRVVRGGGYFNPEGWVRVNARFAVNPASGYEDVGFRCVR